jgi:hypothetical protein
MASFQTFFWSFLFINKGSTKRFLRHRKNDYHHRLYALPLSGERIFLFEDERLEDEIQELPK